MATGLGQTRKLTIIAQDPGFRDDKGLIVTTRIDIPHEDLQPRPLGTRVYVVDYDASTDTLYRPLGLGPNSDPYKAPPFDDTAQPRDYEHYKRLCHCYARSLQVRVRARTPHSLELRRSPTDCRPPCFLRGKRFLLQGTRALLFGYFPSRKSGNIFTCLAHHVIPHETTHALLDGLRARYIDPSSPEQAAFHEGFADIVAILSILSLREVVSAVGLGSDSQVIRREDISEEKLRNSKLLKMADQIGKELSEVRGQALRHSAKLAPLPELPQ